MIDLTIQTPPIELSKYIRRFFLIESKQKTVHLQKVISNPYVYLSFIPNKPPIQNVGNKRGPIVHKLFFSGPIVNEDLVLEYYGNVRHLFYEFTTSGFYSLFHTSPSEFIDNILPLSNLISPKTYNKLLAELVEDKDILHQQRVIEKFLIERSKNALPVKGYVNDALNIIEDHNGYIPSKRIIEEVNVSGRQLRRKFKEIIGLSPKIYSEVLTAHHIISAMQLKDYKSIQELAHSSKYYDLAHFCNRFKKIMGFSPTEFINSEIVDFSKALYSVKN